MGDVAGRQVVTSGGKGSGQGGESGVEGDQDVEPLYAELEVRTSPRQKPDGEYDQLQRTVARSGVTTFLPSNLVAPTQPTEPVYECNLALL